MICNSQVQLRPPWFQMIRLSRFVSKIETTKMRSKLKMVESHPHPHPIPILHVIPASHLVLVLSNIKTPQLSTSSFIIRPTTLRNPSLQPLAALPHHHHHHSPSSSADVDLNTLTKSALYHALEGINRGVFGVTSEKKTQILDLVINLEAHNPTPNPTRSLDKVGGCWKLIYSTITILGSKRTKLGLRDFINLADFLQIIHVSQGKAVNVIKFNARGLRLLNGQLTIQASFSVASPSRVNIKYDSSRITPNQLMSLFEKNYELLLSIFNPDGWLDITYVDEEMRIGRDDKGNIFILERVKEQEDHQS